VSGRYQTAYGIRQQPGSGSNGPREREVRAAGDAVVDHRRCLATLDGKKHVTIPRASRAPSPKHARNAPRSSRGRRDAAPASPGRTRNRIDRRRRAAPRGSPIARDRGRGADAARSTPRCDPASKRQAIRASRPPVVASAP
jgi:hypothetical protein